MTHPQQASAVMTDLWERLAKIGVDDLEYIRLGRGSAFGEGPHVRVRLGLNTQDDVDKVAEEFDLPRDVQPCAFCATGDYHRMADRSTDPAQVLAADESTVYAVVSASSARATAPAHPVGAHS